jgi:hypothetical protein
VAALRRAARERGGPLPSIDVADALLDERLAHRCGADENFAIGGQRRPVNHAATVKTRPGGVAPRHVLHGWCPTSIAPGRKRWPCGQFCGGRVIHEPSVQRTSSPTAGMKSIIRQTSTDVGDGTRSTPARF